MTEPALPSRPARDVRLDFWRGLCMADMVLVHLVYEGLSFGDLVAALVGDWLRFAAGGFVFVAGIGVARVHLPQARDARRRGAAYRGLCRRAAWLLAVHYLAAAAFVALDVARGYRAAPETAALLADLLLLREKPPYADVLPLYVAMLLVAPLLLELWRRRLGLAVLAASAALFVLGQSYPWALSPREGEGFPVVLWQAVFVAGLGFGAALPWIDALATRARAALFATALAAAAGLTGLAHPGWLGLAPEASPVAFTKIPLSPAEAARYLALTTALLLGTALAWRFLAERRVSAGLALLGRRSLAVYVSHVFVQAGVMALAVALYWLGAWQGLLALAALGALLAIAAGLERWDAWTAGAAVRLRATFRGFAAPVFGFAASALLVIALPSATPEASLVLAPAPDDALVSMEAELSADETAPARELGPALPGEAAAPGEIAPAADAERPAPPEPLAG